MLRTASRPTVVWELTGRVDSHPREMDFLQDRLELWTYEAYKTIDEIAAIQPSRFVMTGSDPLQRGDIEQLIDYSRRRGLKPVLALSTTGKVTPESLQRLQRNRLTTVAIRIDNADEEHHDRLRMLARSDSLRFAQAVGLGVEITTLISGRNHHNLPEMVELVKELRAERWNLAFPLSGSARDGTLNATDVEEIFDWMRVVSERVPFPIAAVEAPHYRRHLLKNGRVAVESDSLDTLFITAIGDVTPGELLPLRAGNVRYQTLGAIYRSSDLFVALRDETNLEGKCSRCDFRSVCGGSRARAYAMTGNPFAPDPLCAYQPPGAA